jgi:hypothetical protein
MTAHRKNDSEWRQFEQLVARIESDAAPLGLKITAPDRIRCGITGRLREVDASIRTEIGTANTLVTIECRKRRRRQDVTWIEQLAAKKHAIGADRTIAVSSSEFSRGAQAAAYHHGIDLRLLSEVSATELNALMRIDFVLFTHKRCALAQIGIRSFRSLDWTLPNPGHIDFTLPPNIDPFLPIFKNTDTGNSWSINELWQQLQEAANPFSGIPKGQMPIIKTACFPYPGNVTVDTPTGPKKIGDVLLSVALWLEIEQVRLEEAKKIEYTSPDILAIQRVEFCSRNSGTESWQTSLQTPKDSADVTQLRIGGIWPSKK